MIISPNSADSTRSTATSPIRVREPGASTYLLAWSRVASHDEHRANCIGATVLGCQDELTGTPTLVSVA